MQWQRLHLFVVDLDAFGVGASSSAACTFRPVAGVVAPIRATTTSWLVKARPPVHRDVREQAVLKLVPLAGARWQMAHDDRKTGVAAMAPSSTFHRRVREPLEPTPSGT